MLAGAIWLEEVPIGEVDPRKPELEVTIQS